MKRSYDRLWGVAPPNPNFIAGQLEDDFVHFFQDAWHLKDWLKHDPTSSALVADIEGMINRTTSLALVADLANGSKHLRLTSSRTGDMSTDAITLSFSGDPTVGLTAKLEIQSGGQALDAVAVAKEALADWDFYLQGKGLLT